MKCLHDKVNIVPVIAKADTLTKKEVAELKQRILREINENQIMIYQFPEADEEEDDEEFIVVNKELKVRKTIILFVTCFVYLNRAFCQRADTLKCNCCSMKSGEFLQITSWSPNVRIYIRTLVLLDGGAFIIFFVFYFVGKCPIRCCWEQHSVRSFRKESSWKDIPMGCCRQ